ncbi:LysR family transcriptional regulator [Paucihalobacter ruber]|uniref:LysR family transcriptional regulator n=1 Tax=Paucihalobacter ruber TaxID=2567861 RepID=A0A506PN66_9FLAO|nr:LysR family transcriptional regulator [Paucihalobacter ruber]TPV35064.1 LysR family transcriptional regulator [Paucihalobacter ruber]
MNFTLHQLKVFSEVAHFKSITKAAEALNMTQPAASIQLKNFQDQFDIPLYDVIGRQLYITEFGKEIYNVAQDILNQVSSINYKTEAFKGLLTGKLSISVVSTGNYVMPYFLKGFLQKHPNVELMLDVSNKTQVIKDLEDNLVDFSLVTVSPQHLKVHQQAIMGNKLHLVSAYNSRHISKSKLNINQLNDLPLIFREEGSGTRFTMQEFFKDLNIKPKIQLELSTHEAIIQAVVADIGVSIVSLLGIKNELEQKDLKIVPVKGLPLISEWKLIWLQSKTLSPVALAFLAYVRHNQQDIYHSYFSWQEKY